MNLSGEIKEIWLDAEAACLLLNISKETFRRKCKAGNYVSKMKKEGKYVHYNILLSSLPEKYQEKYHTQKSQINKDVDIEIYSNAPIWARNKADKYLLLFQQTKELKGKELKSFISEWNIKHPELKTSYPCYMSAKKKYEAEGISALLAGYGKNSGRTKINNEYFEYFKSLYLKEGAPSAYSCWLMTLGLAKRTDSVDTRDFPSLSTFKRRIIAEIPEQSVYLARYGESAWNKKYAMYIERDYSNVLAGEVWVSDHAQVDVAVRTEDGKICFPWITAFRDFKTSKWLGWFLHTESPNSDHIFQTFYYSALEYGLPESVYIDNGKDYRAKDFACKRKVSNGEPDNSTHISPMLGLLNIEARFSLPYNAQTKPIERDFLKNKELLSKHMLGYRGGNVVERPEKLKKEIKDNKVLKFADFKILFDDFIENVLNKMPSNGKNLKGKCPDEVWSEEFKIKRSISKDALMLFCMRTSKTYSIGRNGIKDSEFDITYWAEWMSASKGQKIYLRRDVNAYQEAWIFDANNDEYMGKAQIAELTPAIAKNDIQKSELKKALAIKKRDKKLAQSYIKVQDGFDYNENLENMKSAINQKKYAENCKVTKISNTQMDKVIKQDKKNQKQDKYNYSNYLEHSNKKQQIFLYESEKRRAGKGI